VPSSVGQHFSPFHPNTHLQLIYTVGLPWLLRSLVEFGGFVVLVSILTDHGASPRELPRRFCCLSVTWLFLEVWQLRGWPDLLVPAHRLSPLDQLCRRGFDVCVRRLCPGPRCGVRSLFVVVDDARLLGWFAKHCSVAWDLLPPSWATTWAMLVDVQRVAPVIQ